MPKNRSKVLKKGAVKTVKGKRYKLNKNSRWTRYLPEVATAGAVATWGLTTSARFTAELAANASMVMKAKKYGAKVLPIKQAFASQISHIDPLFRKAKIKPLVGILGTYAAVKATQAIVRKAKNKDNKVGAEVTGAVIGVGLTTAAALMLTGKVNTAVYKATRKLAAKTSKAFSPKELRKVKLSRKGWRRLKADARKKGIKIKRANPLKEYAGIDSRYYEPSTGTIFIGRRSPGAIHELHHAKQIGITGKSHRRFKFRDIPDQQTRKQIRFDMRYAVDSNVFGIDRGTPRLIKSKLSYAKFRIMTNFYKYKYMLESRFSR